MYTELMHGALHAYGLLACTLGDVREDAFLRSCPGEGVVRSLREGRRKDDDSKGWLKGALKSFARTTDGVHLPCAALVVGGPRGVSERSIRSGSCFSRVHVQTTTYPRASLHLSVCKLCFPWFWHFFV